MKLTKQDTRLRRALRSRAKIKELAVLRLSVHRTPQHIYAQIFAAEGDKVLVAASTLQKDVRGELKTTGNIEAAKPWDALLQNGPRQRASPGSHSTGPALCITGASKRWPRPRAKRVSSSNSKRRSLWRE
jgi:hypothetical protein